MTTTRPPERGMQPERTALAWRRTGLTVAVGSLAATRVLADPLGAAGVVLGVVGLLWSLDLGLTARRRYAAAQRMVRAGPDAAAADAGPEVVRAWCATLVVGASALVAVVVMSTGG